MLAFLGFHMEYSDLVRREFIHRIAFAGRPGQGGPEHHHEGDVVVVDSRRKKEDAPREKLKPEDRSELVTKIAITSRRVVGNTKDTRNLWSWPGFLKDGPPPVSPKKKSHSKRLRPTRSKF
jgi:hypothetical protein